MQQVLVLNASFEPLNVTSVRRAHVLVFKGKAEVIEKLSQPLHSATDTYPWPHVIRLVAYVRVPRAVQRKISRRALFARDGWRCVYCGTTAGRLTLDHVIPRSRGGESVWENVVTACAPCNHQKGNRSPEEARMELVQPPKAPAPVLFIRLAAPKIPNGWQPYLAHFASATGYVRRPAAFRRPHLKADVLVGELGLRPMIVLQDGHHPLLREQQQGITIAECSLSTALVYTRSRSTGRSSCSHSLHEPGYSLPSRPERWKWCNSTVAVTPEPQ